MSGLFGLFTGIGGSKSKSQSDSETFVDPNQSPFLQDLYRQAQMLNSQGMPVEGVAGLNPMLLNSMMSSFNAGGMQGGSGANLMGFGANAMTGTGNALNFANNAMGSSFAPGVNAALGTAGMFGGMTGMANAANNMGFNKSNVANYINNDVLNNQIDAASRDVVRNLTEVTRPQILSNAAATGNTGSSRTGNELGIAARSAGDRIGDIAASMRSNAYDTGLGIEANRAAQNAGFTQQANLANQAAFNNMLQFGGNLGQSAFQNNLANQQFGATLANQIGRGGVDALLRGANLMNMGIDRQLGVGNMFRDYDQSLLNYDFRRGMSPFNALNFYSQIVGDPNNLSRSSSSKSSSSFNLGFGG